MNARDGIMTDNENQNVNGAGASMQTAQQKRRTATNWLKRNCLSFLLLLACVPAWAGVDLVPTAVSTTATDVLDGTSFTVNGAIKNQGTTATSNSFYEYFYLSTDATITTSDFTIGSRNFSGILAAGTSYTLPSTTVNVPSWMPSGTYYLGMIVDPTNTQAETDETNNAMVAVGTITIIRNVDLIPTVLSTAATSVPIGGTITISSTIENQGTTPTSNYFNVYYYLSTDATITTTDTRIGTKSFSGVLGPAVSYSYTPFSASIPSSTSPGTYYLGVIVDPLNAESETDETNNAMAVATINVYAMIAPNAPTSVTATGGNAQATVTFTAPAPNGGPDITGYTVTSSPAGGVDSNAGTTSLSHVITNLANGTAYTFTVTATNAAGTSAASAPSNSVTPTDIPQVYYIHTDQLDTPRVITDTNGNVVWRWDNADPFGANMANENPNGAGQFSFNLRFPGQYYDRETNLHYNIYRDYDPAIGRYVESDPIGLLAGINTYAYVEGDPLSLIDPFGLYTCVGKAKCSFSDRMDKALKCFDEKTHRDTKITSGCDSHKSDDPHMRGEGADIGRNSNPALTRQDAEKAFKECFPQGDDGSYAQEEYNKGPGTHFHFQYPSGLGGATGFAPGIKERKK